MTRSRRVVVNLNRPQMRPQTQKKKKKITAVGRLIRAAGTAGGSALGTYFGMPELGGAAGNQLAALASKWMGFGAYSVNRNSILKTTEGVPSMHSTNQTITVRHKEYVGPITSSVGFNVLYELPLNPGLESTFSWLSGVASRYQQYVFKGVVFHYVPTSGVAIAGTNPALGTVMMQTSYRASEDAPTSKIEMLNEYCASEAMPSEAFIHPIECDPKENPFSIHYCRSLLPPNGEPLLSYDLGHTFVAVQGQQESGHMLGDLWVTYEVELKKPVVRGDVTQGGHSFVTTVPTATDLFAGPTDQTGSLGASYHTGNTIKIASEESGPWLVLIDFTSAFSAFNWTGALTLNNGTARAINSNGDLYCSTQITSGSAQTAIAFVINKINPRLETSIVIGGVSWTGTVTRATTSVFALDAFYA